MNIDSKTIFNKWVTECNLLEIFTIVNKQKKNLYILNNSTVVITKE